MKFSPAVPVALALGALVPSPQAAGVPAASFADGFEKLDARWGCEYACPALSGGIARFTVGPGALATPSTWNKLTHKDATFGYGTYTMKFRFSRRPLETETWAGWALYAEVGGKPEEINFGIETACKQRCDDRTLILESYKLGVNQEVLVATGADLFDGTWHTVRLDYSAKAIHLDFDGKRLASITDVSKIPTSPMKLIPGARVITGSLTSEFLLEVDSLDYAAPGGPTDLLRRENKTAPIGARLYKGNLNAPFDAKGRALD